MAVLDMWAVRLTTQGWGCHALEAADIDGSAVGRWLSESVPVGACSPIAMLQPDDRRLRGR